MASVRECADALALISAAYPTVTFTEASAAAWAHWLADIPGEILLPAVSGLLATRTSSFPPIPREVREAAMGGLLEDDSDAYDAWSAVFDQIARVGGYGRPVLSEAAHEAVRVACGGWTRLCRSHDHEMAAQRKRFIDYYTSKKSAKRRCSLLPPSVHRILLEDHARRLSMGETDPEP